MITSRRYRMVFCTLAVILWSVLVPVLAQTTAEQAEQAFFTAKGMYQDQLYDLAADQFRDFLRKYPDNPYAEEAQFLIAECYFQKQDYSRAVAAYRELLSNYPAIGLRDKAQFRIGESLVNAGQYEEAQRALQFFFEPW